MIVSALELTPGPMSRVATAIMARAGLLLALGLVIAFGAWVSASPIQTLGLGLLAGTLASCIGIAWVLKRLDALIEDRAFTALFGLPPPPDTTLYLTDEEGHILRHVGAVPETGMLCELADLELPAETLDGLRERALESGRAGSTSAESGGLFPGKPFSVTVTRMAPDRLLWEIVEKDRRERSAAGENGVRLPMLRVGKSGTVLFQNPAAREFLGARAKSLSEVFPSGPPRHGMMSDVSTANGIATCMVADLESSAGRREIYLLEGSRRQADPEESVSFKRLPVPLLKVTPDGAVLDANNMARNLINCNIPIGTDIADLMEGLGRSIADWLGEAAAGRGLHHSEFLRLRRPDAEVFVQVTITRLVENGKVSLIAVLNDATELKTLEAQFVQSQKMQAIGQLAGGVAHDFNNLLTAISGHCDLLLLRHDQGDPDYGDLVQINQNANRAAALVGQLLAFSRKQTLRPEVLDLRNTLADLTHLLNRLVGEKISLTLSHDPTLKTIRADKRQLEQVLMNLVVNARDAMPERGETRAHTTTIGLQTPWTRDRAVVPPGQYVSVKVADGGCGIAPDKLQKVFEPFYTTKRTGEGTGLGLSTAYGIVKQTGGFIFVDSTVGSGTCFTLLFPVHDSTTPAEVQPKEVETTGPARHGEGVILLVEDEAPVRAFASRALRLRGYTVLEAESGEAALNVLEDETLRVDLFVTDVVMPGLDGPGWVRKAREKRPETRVVFVSGYAEDSFSDQQAKIANSVFLPKPFSLADLNETVQRQFQ